MRPAALWWNALRFSTLLFALQAQATEVVRLSTTTSTDHSGLLDHLLPLFEARTGVRVVVISVGTGKALQLARQGDVDVTLVHARQAEEAFVASGHGLRRHEVMYNDFVVVCPSSDPAGIRGARDVVAAFRRIAAGGTRFVSRGDHSGTDLMEQQYWGAAATRPAKGAYVSAGLGMGQALGMAAELQACTLSDRATYSTYKARTGLAVMVEGDRRMRNPYGIIAVNPARHPGVNAQGARLLIEWMSGPEGQQAIAQFRPGGQQLFFPARP